MCGVHIHFITLPIHLSWQQDCHSQQASKYSNKCTINQDIAKDADLAPPLQPRPYPKLLGFHVNHLLMDCLWAILLEHSIIFLDNTIFFLEHLILFWMHSIRQMLQRKLVCSKKKIVFHNKTIKFTITKNTVLQRKHRVLQNINTECSREKN